MAYFGIGWSGEGGAAARWFTRQRLALPVRYHVEQEGVRLARIEKRQNVGVLEVRRGFDLCQESLGSDHRSQLGLQDLKRDVAVVLQVFGPLDGGHPAFTSSRFMA